MSTWKAVLTEKGEALLAKMTQGSALTITHAEVGAGTVDASLLKQQTSVATMKQRATIEPVGYPAEGMCALPVTITNEGLSAGYSAWQIGIFANDPDEGTVLFFIAQAEDIATGVPSPALMPSYKTQIIFHVEYGDADSVNVDVNPANAVSQAAMENYVNAKVGTAKEDIASHTANKQNPHGVTAAQLGLGTVKSDLAAHTANKQNPHGVTADQIGAAKTTHKHSASDINSGTLAIDRLPKDDLVNLHIWKKYSANPSGYSLGTITSADIGYAYYTGSSCSLFYSDRIEIVNGIARLKDPINLIQGTANLFELIKGKFASTYSTTGTVYFVLPDATLTMNSNKSIHISSAQKVTATSSVYLGYVASKVNDTYPTSGEHTDGYWYEYQKQLGEAPAPAFTYGTEDLEAGVSPLETGKLYFVYE